MAYLIPPCPQDGHIRKLCFLNHSANRYTFMGTNSSGINAFFVRNDLVVRLGDKKIPVKSFPMRASDTRDELGTLTFIHGPAKVNLIKHLPVIDVETGLKTTLGELGPLYSEEWLNLLRGSTQ